MYYQNLRTELSQIAPALLFGRVTAVLGMLVEVGGIHQSLAVGSRCNVFARDGRKIPGEVIGFRNDAALLLPFSGLDGVGVGCRTELSMTPLAVYPTQAWLGRVINAMGEPVDGGGPLPKGGVAQMLRSTPPPAHARKRVRDKLDLGVRSLNTFLTCCRGQRMGIFAGSGVGKSVLMSMLARNTASDVAVIGLIGERGREVQEFIEDDLGEEGLRRSVVVVATSDESALMRRQAAYLTMTMAEFFRDTGADVLCMIDSITRFAMAQREIGLAAGEPPASKGYTPTVFSELPRLLERAGPGVHGAGDISGLFTVLVEGDDHNEPIADAVRGILDGHVVLDRAIAERGRYPAINILRSISRTMPGCNTDAQNRLVARARELLARYDDMAEMIRLGAYRMGADPLVDEAIKYNPALEDFLSQSKGEAVRLDDCYGQLAALLGEEVDDAVDAGAVDASAVDASAVDGEAA